MSNLTIEYLRENTCRDCRKRYCASGYVLCPGCLNGFPRVLDDVDIKRIKQDDALEKEGEQ